MLEKQKRQGSRITNPKEFGSNCNITLPFTESENNEERGRFLGEDQKFSFRRIKLEISQIVMSI